MSLCPDLNSRMLSGHLDDFHSNAHVFGRVIHYHRAVCQLLSDARPSRDSLHINSAEPIVQAVLGGHDGQNRAGSQGTGGHRFTPSPGVALVQRMIEVSFRVLDQHDRCEPAEVLRPARSGDGGVSRTFKRLLTLHETGSGLYRS